MRVWTPTLIVLAAIVLVLLLSGCSGNGGY
jgi:outer membrane murein-binding lipoprotein Lpp